MPPKPEQASMLAPFEHLDDDAAQHAYVEVRQTVEREDDASSPYGLQYDLSINDLQQRLYKKVVQYLKRDERYHPASPITRYAAWRYFSILNTVRLSCERDHHPVWLIEMVLERVTDALIAGDWPL